MKKYSVLPLWVLSLILGLNLVYAGDEPSVSFIDPPLNFHTPGTELMLSGANFNTVEEVFYNKVAMPSCRIVHDGMIDQCIIPAGATIPESSDNNNLITFKVKAPPPPSSTGGVKPPPPAVEVKAFPLTPAQEKQISKKSLEEIFIEEIKKHPGLQAFFQNETQKPFQYALKALQEKRHVEKFPQTHPKGRKDALKSWLKENRERYLDYAGINEFINEEAKKLVPVITSVPKTKVEPNEMMEMYGKNFTYKKTGDNFNYSNYKDVFFVKDGIETLAKDVGVNITGAPDGGNLIRLRTPKEAGNYSIKITLKEGDPVIWNKTLIAITGKTPEIAKEERPLFSYTSNGPVVMSSDMQQYVKTTYTYDKEGRISGAQGQGTFTLDDGFGNKNKGTITQEYKTFNSQAKLTKNNVENTVSYVNGSTAKQNTVTTYTYDSSGKLLSAEGSGTVDSKDGLGDNTKSTIEQTYTIVNGQAKEKDAKIDSKTQNVDGSWKEQKVTTTYKYDDNGKLNAVSGNGTFKKDDGFGNTSTGNIVQKYEVVAGQAKLVSSTPTDETTRNIAAEKEKKDQEELAKKKAEEELAQKKAQEELAKKQAEELAKKQVEEEAARQKTIEEAMEKQRQIEKSRAPAEQKPAEQKAEEKKYCDPELPKFWQPGCIEQGKEAPQQKESEDQVPTYSKPKQPAAQKPTQEGAKICDPNVPRYSQPGCVEQ